MMRLIIIPKFEIWVHHSTETCSKGWAGRRLRNYAIPVEQFKDKFTNLDDKDKNNPDTTNKKDMNLLRKG